jgi:condensin complex subunit 3
LFISPASTEEKIRILYEDISSAVDEGLLTDATSRNALYKIHVSLGKIVNQLDSQDKTSSRRSVSRSVSVAPSIAPSVASTGSHDKTSSSIDEDDATVVPGRRSMDAKVLEDVAEEEADGDGDTVVRRAIDESLVDELLTDDDV